MLNVSSTLQKVYLLCPPLILVSSCCFAVLKLGTDLKFSVYLQYHRGKRHTIFLQLIFKKGFKHSGRFQEAQWVSSQRVFDEVPSSSLWCLSLYLKRRQSPFVFTTAQWRQRRREILIKKRLQYKHFASSLLYNGTSAKPHITVIPFKAQQLSLVPFKQLIYLTGLLAGDSPSLL